MARLDIKAPERLDPARVTSIASLAFSNVYRMHTGYITPKDREGLAALEKDKIAFMTYALVSAKGMKNIASSNWFKVG